MGPARVTFHGSHSKWNSPAPLTGWGRRETPQDTVSALKTSPKIIINKKIRRKNGRKQKGKKRIDGLRRRTPNETRSHSKLMKEEKKDHVLNGKYK